MKSFEQIVDECPENVRAFVAQTTVVNEFVRILRDIEAFKSTLVSCGYDPIACERARKVFVLVQDGFSRAEKVA